MLAEFFDRIVALAQKAKTPQQIKLDGMPRKTLIATESGSVMHDVPPPDRGHRFASLNDFIGAASDRAIAVAPEVYFGLSGAIAYCDRADRRETLTLSVQLTAKWKAAAALDTATRFFQPKDALRFLRFELGVDKSEPIYTGLMRIDFTRNVKGGSVNEHGRESLGRQVEAAVQQADQVPETFMLYVGAFENPGCEPIAASMRVGVILDLEQQQIGFRLMPGELASATRSVLDRFGQEIRKGLPDVPVFNGSPS